jgi:hypothetical protein
MEFQAAQPHNNPTQNSKRSKMMYGKKWYLKRKEKKDNDTAQVERYRGSHEAHGNQHTHSMSFYSPRPVFTSGNPTISDQRTYVENHLTKKISQRAAISLSMSGDEGGNPMILPIGVDSIMQM